MRIISGFLRGKEIPTIRNAKYRPSTGKFKEALFSILNSAGYIDGAVVLDLFSGTGSLGFEAISRCAKHATFVDIDSLHLNTAKSFATANNLTQFTRFLRADSTNLLPTDLKYDLVFVDPPYGFGIARKSLDILHRMEWLADGAIIVVEIGAKEKFDDPEWCEKIDMRIYGGSKLIILKAKASNQ